MAVDKKYIRKLIKNMGFAIKDGSSDISEKKYPNHNDYSIHLDFKNDKIIYETDEKSKCVQVLSATTSNFFDAENLVVLECVDRLLTKGYKPQFIELEHSWGSGHGTSGRLDIIVRKENGVSYLMIECKTYGDEYKKEKKNMLSAKKIGNEDVPKGQLFTYFIQEKTTEYLCLYTSRLQDNTIKFENSIILIDDEWKNLSNQKEVFDYWNKNFKYNGIFEDWSLAYNIECKALLRRDLQKITDEDSSKIFNQFLEILRHNAVSDKPNSFNKILNLFICKIVDEDRKDNEEVKFQWKDDSTYISMQSELEDLYKIGMEKFLEIEVTDYSNMEIDRRLINLDDNSKKDIKKMFQELRLQKNPEFAFKEVYNQKSFEENVKVVREVVELLQPYQFRYGHKQQFLGNFFELLLNTSIKQEAGQFFTPVAVAKFMISCLPIKKIIEEKINENGKRILPVVIDYATGSGHFLTEWMDIVQQIINDYDTSKLNRSAKNKIEKWKQCEDEGESQGEFEWAKDYVYGIEKDYRLVKTAKISTFLNGDGEANILHADGLDSFNSIDYKGLLSAKGKENENFDVVVANPPYSVSSFKRTLKNGSDSFELFELLTEDSSEIECIFIERTIQLLKDNMFASIVMPCSFLTNTGSVYNKTRELLIKNFHVKGIASMGSNTFMATTTNTVILFLQKKPIYICKNIEYAIMNFFNTKMDTALNKVNNIFGKYVNNTFQHITFNDYITLIEKRPNNIIITSSFYKEFEKYFLNHVELKNLRKKKEYKELNIDGQFKKEKELFYYLLFSVEKEKMLYFLLTYMDKTVVLKTGEKQMEKDFLGYYFSDRKGYEGIHYYTEDGTDNGRLLTKLYDEYSLNDNPEKANYYFYNAFLNNYPEIDDSLKQNLMVINTSNLFNFEKVVFDKIMYIKEREFIIPSQYPQKRLGNMVTMPIQRGKSTDYGNSHIQIIKSGQARGFLEFDFSKKHNVSDDFISDERNLLKEDILINSSGVGTAGRVTLFELDGDFVVDSHVSIVRLNQKEVIPQYVLYALSIIGFKNIESLATGQSGQIELGVDTINDIKIPIPPVDIQQKIVDRYTEFETKLSIQKTNLHNFNEQILSLIVNIEDKYTVENILQDIEGSVIRIPKNKIHKTGKFPVIGQTSDVFIDGYCNEKEYISDIPLVVFGDHTCCVKYVDFAFVRGADGTKLLKSNQDLMFPKYLYYSLLKISGLIQNKDKYERHYKYLKDMKISVPSLPEQKKILDRIRELEIKSRKTEEEIYDLKQMQTATLNEYLCTV